MLIKDVFAQFLAEQQSKLAPKTYRDYEQIPRSSRRNPLPMKRINWSLVMRHEYLACALV
jgi:hypothetical protein